ncbi:uncharacterized protein LOC103461375 [Poecilia reticulata]|uniref:Uncharacterized LOC103461375 n=1 Tax=Poecilia reticulata TaxID=8081 RepID=A0A3P9NGK8_POERE|nr:PREDICTED: uncharacterized protein LOC103461375 [Poecilia reticulata]
MAPSGPVLLLLLLSSFLTCSLSVPPHLDLPEKIKDQGITFVNDIGKILNTLEPLIALIPEAGPYLSVFIKILTNEAQQGEKIIRKLEDEFKTLNQKLDKQLTTMTWNTWASGPYQEAETNIRLAWKQMNELLDVCEKPCFAPKEKEKNVALFKTLHQSLVFSPDKLHMLLTTKQPSFIINFRTLLTDHVRCHEESIVGFTELISELMIRSNTINLFYYKLHGINKAEEMSRMTFEMFSVMSEIHRFCIENPEKYIEKDVVDMIDENQNRQQLAMDIKGFLDKTYSRYDWIVVAFITRHSKYSVFYTKFLNKHYLDRFTEVSKGEVTVAVAKQTKGEYTMAEMVKGKIKKCIDVNTKCEKVIETLNSCPKIDGRTLSEFYSAVHVYVGKSHDSADEPKQDEEVEQDEFNDIGNPNALQPYIYTGECKKYKIFKGGHFRVMIRSNEDLDKKDLCENVKCGGPEKGKCVRLKNIPKVVCVCNEGYTGSQCDISRTEFQEVIKEATKPLGV